MIAPTPDPAERDFLEIVDNTMIPSLFASLPYCDSDGGEMQPVHKMLFRAQACTTSMSIMLAAGMGYGPLAVLGFDLCGSRRIRTLTGGGVDVTKEATKPIDPDVHDTSFPHLPTCQEFIVHKLDMAAFYAVNQGVPVYLIGGHPSLLKDILPRISVGQYNAGEYPEWDGETVKTEAIKWLEDNGAELQNGTVVLAAGLEESS
jgi:hypothetical protein